MLFVDDQDLYDGHDGKDVWLVYLDVNHPHEMQLCGAFEQKEQALGYAKELQTCPTMGRGKQYDIHVELFALNKGLL